MSQFGFHDMQAIQKELQEKYGRESVAGISTGQLTICLILRILISKTIQTATLSAV